MPESQISSKELEALRAIRSHLMRYGKMPSVRELMKELNYRSPRSASVMIRKLIDKNILEKKPGGGLRLIRYEVENSGGAPQEQTVKVPLLGSVSCGLPVYAEENIEAEISVSVKIARPPGKYYLLKARGDSMNLRGINDGDLVLVKYQEHAESGDMVVALIDNEVTVKELKVNNDNVVLLPRSTNKTHTPVILSRDFAIQGVVVSVIPV